MNTKHIAIVMLCLIGLGLGAVAILKAAPPPPTTATGLETAFPVADPGPPDPVVDTPAPPEPERPSAVAAEPLAEPAPADPEVADPPGKLTARTLAGTRWEQGVINTKFHPDGTWEMNGRVCAKWEVVGDRVRIFDGSGEEYYLDIVGDSLEFKGQKIARKPE